MRPTVGNLKATASKTMWKRFESKLSKMYHKKVFWTSSYFIASTGGVSLETLIISCAARSRSPISVVLVSSLFQIDVQTAIGSQDVRAKYRQRLALTALEL